MTSDPAATPARSRLHRRDRTPDAPRPARIVLPTLALILTSALTACSGGATPSPSASASPSPSPSAAASPSPSAASSPSVSPSAAPSSGVIGTTGTVEIAGEGFRITLADGWQAIDLDEGAIDRIAALFPTDSDIGKVLQSQAGSLALAGVRLFALDPRPSSIADGMAPNLNVIVQAKPAGLTVELLGTVAKAQLEAVEAFSDVAIEPITLPAGPAIMASYGVEQSLADGSTLKATGRQYYLTSDTSLFIVTMTGSSAALDPTLDAMAQSIEID